MKSSKKLTERIRQRKFCVLSLSPFLTIRSISNFCSCCLSTSEIIGFLQKNQASKHMQIFRCSWAKQSDRKLKKPNTSDSSWTKQSDPKLKKTQDFECSRFKLCWSFMIIVRSDHRRILLQRIDWLLLGRTHIRTAGFQSSAATIGQVIVIPRVSSFWMKIKVAHCRA